jgi:hypothetical protein
MQWESIVHELRHVDVPMLHTKGAQLMGVLSMQLPAPSHKLAGE